ncbi:unnamed protein product, partial [Staurois parvus]
CPIIGVSGGRNSAPSLVSVGGGIVPHHRCQWGGGIVPHHRCQWGEEYCPILGVSGGEE